MFLTRLQLDELLADPTMYFKTVPESNNIDLIRKMTLHKYFTAASKPKNKYVCVREDDPDGWARTVTCCYNAVDVSGATPIMVNGAPIVCSIDGTSSRVETTVVCKYHLCLDGNVTTSIITFNLEGEIISHLGNNEARQFEWELYRCFAPQRFVDEIDTADAHRKAKRKAERRVRFGYVDDNLQVVDDDASAVWSGTRYADFDDKWVTYVCVKDATRKIKMTRNAMSWEIEYHYELRTPTGKTKGHIVFHPDGTVAWHVGDAFDSDTLRVFCWCADRVSA